MKAGMNPEEKRRLAALLRAQRWAALATARDNEPLAPWVAVRRRLGGFCCTSAVWRCIHAISKPTRAHRYRSPSPIATRTIRRNWRV
jgi:hypothetical protein